MRHLYGFRGHSAGAGYTPLNSWKKQLTRLFGTLKTAIRKNVNGDDRHRDEMMERCDVAIDAIRRSKYKDEIMNYTITFCFEISFALLGHRQDNWQDSKAHHSHVTQLNTYRTFAYVRTPTQIARQITDAAYKNRLSSWHPSFEILIGKLRGEFHNDAEKFVKWIRTEYPDLYSQFN